MGQTNMVHNGLLLEVSEPLAAMAGVGGQRGGLIFEVAAVEKGTQYNEPFAVRSLADLVLIPKDSIGYHCLRFLLETAGVPIDVVLVPVGDTAEKTAANIIGGVEDETGQLIGLEAFKRCKEMPTNIGVATSGGIAVLNAMAGLVDKIYAEGWVNGTDTNTKAALALGSESLGEVHERVWCVDVSGERWDHPIPPSVYGMAARLAVKPWNTPNGFPLPLDDLSRDVGYTVNDSGSEAVSLNKFGISLAVADPDGGTMFLGNRTGSGKFGNIVGIENQIIRAVIKSHRKTMKYNLDPDFFKLRIAQIDNWGASLTADGAIIGMKVYLHPTRNNINRYKNGEWVLVIEWGAYRPNECSIIELNQNDVFVENLLNSQL